MNWKINKLFILIVCISMGLIACNQGDKKEETTTTTDSTTTVKTDTTQPVVEETAVDAVKSNPNFYKLIADTMGIRILEATYKPGDSSSMHSHPDYAIYVIDGGTAEFTGKDGKKVVNQMKAGSTNIIPAEVHSVKNTGKTTEKVFIVEVNRPKGAASGDASMDAAKVASDLYKTMNDSLGIRVLEATYKPGQSSALHGHPDYAIYVIAGGTAEFTDKDGKKTVSEMKTGMSRIKAAEVHSVKNTGKTTVKVLMVEVNRAIK